MLKFKNKIMNRKIEVKGVSKLTHQEMKEIDGGFIIELIIGIAIGYLIYQKFIGDAR